MEGDRHQSRKYGFPPEVLDLVKEFFKAQNVDLLHKRGGLESSSGFDTSEDARPRKQLAFI